MTMTLHYGTGSCSLLVHRVLEVLGLPFEPVKVDLRFFHETGFSDDPPATRLPDIESFLNRLATRPAVSRALAREGITLFS